MKRLRRNQTSLGAPASRRPRVGNNENLRFEQGSAGGTPALPERWSKPARLNLLPVIVERDDFALWLCAPAYNPGIAASAG
jgi:hypothetical protein